MDEGRLRATIRGFHVRTITDPRIAPYFEGRDVDWIERHAQKALAAAAGPGWDGRAAADVEDHVRAKHAGVAVTRAHFDIVAGHLEETLRAEGWPARVRIAISGTLTRLRSAVSGVLQVQGLG